MKCLNERARGADIALEITTTGGSNKKEIPTADQPG